MEFSKKVRFFIKKNFYTLIVLEIILGTLIMFYALYFSNKPATIETLIENKKNPMMYLCVLFSFGGSILFHYMIGGFNKENIKKMTSMKEFEE